MGLPASAKWDCWEAFYVKQALLLWFRRDGLRPHGDDNGVIGITCGESDVAGTPTQRPRKLSKRGRARCGTDRTGFILAVLRRRGGLGGGDWLSMLWANEEGAT